MLRVHFLFGCEMFSVLMSVYCNDDPKQLRQALESMLCQSFLPSEVILVIDGIVPDTILNVIKIYEKGLNIKRLQLPKNVGLGNALNFGLEIASYEWIVRMDSDDICRPDRFELQAKFIAEFPDVDVFGGGISEFIISPDLPVSEREVPLSNEEIYMTLRSSSPFNHVTVAFKKSIVASIGGYEGGKNFQEDMLLWYKLASINCVFGNIDKILVDVRVGEQMLKRRGGLDYYLKEVKVNYFGYRKGLVPLRIFIFNLLVKFFVRTSPLFVREKLYSFARRGRV